MATDGEDFVKAWICSNPHMCMTSQIQTAVEEAAKSVLLRDQPAPKRSRLSVERCKDYWSTKWGKLLTNPQNRIEGTRVFKLFRRRFRMPAELFLDYFIPRVKAVNLFEMTYDSRIPVEIKCLIALRILGRGHSSDDNWDGCEVCESTCTAIFHKFIRGMVRHFFVDSVKPPTGDRLAQVMATYSRLGYPGAVGSIDCTHIFWGKCPVSLTNLCKGKEKTPSLSFEVVVDHDGFIHSCTKGFVGTCSDKMIVVNDAYAKQVARGLYKDLEFSLYDENGEFTTFRGGYFISDCGYTRMWMFQMPLLNVHDPRSVYWSEFLESVRKDVERTFGILKARFVYLAQKVQHHDAGMGGYAIKLNLLTVLDCYDQRSQCFACMANCFRNLRSSEPSLPFQPHENCEIVVSSTLQGIVYLKTTKFVCANTEFFWDYGDEYIYPA